MYDFASHRSPWTHARFSIQKESSELANALAHEYLSPYHDPTDEPVAEEKFDWSFNDADLPVDTWKDHDVKTLRTWRDNSG